MVNLMINDKKSFHVARQKEWKQETKKQKKKIIILIKTIPQLDDKRWSNKRDFSNPSAEPIAPPLPPPRPAA